MLLIKENQKLIAISYKTRLNQRQSASCALWDKRRWLTHQKFNQPFEIKAQNHGIHVILEGKDKKTIPAQEIRSQIVKKESFWDYKEEVKQLWKNCSMP